MSPKKSRGFRGSHRVSAPSAQSAAFYFVLLLDWFSTNLLSAAFSGQGLLDTFLFAWFQVERVFLDFFDDVFLLNLAFESPQGIFNGFSVLNPYFCQSVHPHSTSAINRQTTDYSAVSTFASAILPPLWRVVRCVQRGPGRDIAR